MDVPSGGQHTAAIRGQHDARAAAAEGASAAWERFRCAEGTTATTVLQSLADALRSRLAASRVAISTAHDGVPQAARAGDLLPRPSASLPQQERCVSPAGAPPASSDEPRMAHPLTLADGRPGTLQVWRRDTGFDRDEHQLAVSAASRIEVLLERVAHEDTLAELRLESIRTRESRKLETLGVLVRGVAHDVNNLLQVILGGVQLLTDDAAPGDPRADTANRVNEAIDVATALSRQLVDFAREKAGAPRPVSLDAVVGGVDRLMATLLGDSHRLELVLDAGDALVLADPAALAQIVLNLVLNARDAMPEGGTVRIRTHRTTLEDRPAVCLTVRDEGVGMDEAVRARIFEPLFTTKGPEQGSGLGLSTVRRIVREIGGCIRVETAPGEGSTFDVCLPNASADG